jgi:hypothetical protein
MPLNILSRAFYLFIYSKAKMILPFLLGFKYNLLFSLLGLLAGLIFLKRKTALFLCLAPIFIHLILSGLQLYPFEKRTALYLMPFFILIISSGILNTFNYVKTKKVNLPIYLLLLFFVLNLIHVFKNIPTENEEVKKSMNYINTNIKDSDSINVYFISEPAYLFYRNQYKGLKDKPYRILGNWKMKTWTDYQTEINAINGKSWLIFSEGYSIGSLNGENFVIQCLESSGHKVLSKRKFTGSSCYEVIKK